MPKLTSISVNLNVPLIGGIAGTWEPNEDEKKAAWEMYVELVTRISVVNLEQDEGLLREALSSLYTLFDTTRKILRKYGPSIAQPKRDDLSFGYISVNILNTVIRPVLAKWHPILLDYENKRPESLSPLEHERTWERNRELRQELEEVRLKLIEYTDLLSEVAGVPSLIIRDTNE